MVSSNSRFYYAMRVYQTVELFFIEQNTSLPLLDQSSKLLSPNFVAFFTQWNLVNGKVRSQQKLCSLLNKLHSTCCALHTHNEPCC